MGLGRHNVHPPRQPCQDDTRGPDTVNSTSPTPAPCPTLHDRRPSELEGLVEELGQPRYRGRQLARGLFVRGVDTLDELSDLPKSLRVELATRYGLTVLRPVEQQASGDGTTKYLLELGDQRRIEAVSIPRSDGQFTFCISSQVGCRMACVFCATGRMGLVRQLGPGEIVRQVLELRRRHPGRGNPNLVFMGMGEPLDNFEALAIALDILTDPRGLGLSARRITVSTSGLVPGIRRLQMLGRPYGLAVSLTSGDPDRRRRLMPLAGRTPIEELLEAAADYGRATRRKVTLECALIRGENDSLEDARQLLRWTQRGPFKVNLIPLNTIERYPGERPDETTVTAFADVLWQGGVIATVRDSAGREVGAACGQLLHRQRRRGRIPS